MKIYIKQEKLRAFARKHGARFVILYGSYAAGRPNGESDVDVAAFFKQGQIPDNFSVYSKVVGELGEMFRAGTGTVDFVILNTANILLRYEITAKGKLLYGPKDEYEQYKAFAFREYVDAKSLFELESFMIKKRQRLIRKSVLV